VNRRRIPSVSRIRLVIRSLGGCATTAWLVTCCLAVAGLEAQESPDLPAQLAPVVSELKTNTKVPILLPSQLPALAQEKVYAHAKAEADSYTIRLESDPDCDGANACFLGILSAKRGGRFSFPHVVKLNENTTARFRPTTCGGSCSEQAIEWKYKGFLYTSQLNLKTDIEKEACKEMIELARSAIRYGPR
jgi:hypothetical protein